MRTPGLAISFRDDDKQLAFYGAEIGNLARRRES